MKLTFAAITVVAALSPLALSWLVRGRAPVPQNVSRETDAPKLVRTVQMPMTLPAPAPPQPPPIPVPPPIAAPPPPVPVVVEKQVRPPRAVRRERRRARYVSLNVCERHGMRMKVTRGGRSWRCRH